MKIIRNSKEITTLEVDDIVIFGTLKYRVAEWASVYNNNTYFLYLINNDKESNEAIFQALSLNKKDFVQNLGIDAYFRGDFPEVKTLEALTAIVSALFKEYEKQKDLPKTWDEFCDNYPVTNKEAILSHNSVIITFDDFPNSSIERDPDVARNLCTSSKEAEAFLAFMQLRQLRKAYVKNWEPDWKDDNEPKYCINLQANSFDVQCWYHMSNPFSFPTARLAKQFLDNFRDLLEVAKPLL